MKCGLLDKKETTKFAFLDDDKQRLTDTLAFLPEYSLADLKEYQDSAVEQAYNGGWYLKGYSPEKPQPTEEELLEQAKSERAEEVKKITVTTKSGKTFDGDEDSQTRMARAILASEATGLNETLWVLANNSIEKVTVAELKEAFTKAGAKQTELWIKPYQAEKV